ncbi:hypothetical protein ACIQMP_08740 [Streptomyces sp. NPDC091385]|uniref:hypothetical protein n=1 Tax=Streptomyces sp. NPDC091385 TaxID=3365997 RepID=UPI003805BDA7
MFGKRRILLCCRCLLVVGSLICAFSSALVPMVIGRALQGGSMGVIPLGVSMCCWRGGACRSRPCVLPGASTSSGRAGCPRVSSVCCSASPRAATGAGEAVRRSGCSPPRW